MASVPKGQQKDKQQFNSKVLPQNFCILKLCCSETLPNRPSKLSPISAANPALLGQVVNRRTLFGTAMNAAVNTVNICCRKHMCKLLICKNYIFVKIFIPDLSIAFDELRRVLPGSGPNNKKPSKIDTLITATNWCSTCFSIFIEKNSIQDFTDEQ